MDKAPDLPQQRSPFSHAPFFSTLCCCHRLDKPFQQIYSSKSVLQMIMERAFVEPAREIDLLEAARNGQMSELKAKLHLTDVDINSEGSDGRTGVFWAGETGKTEALKLLLQHGGDPNRADQYGATPVHAAAVSRNTEALQLLLQYGGDPNRAEGSRRQTPVHKAVHRHPRGNTEALQLLLQYGGDPNRADKRGETPEHIAASNGKTKALQLLRASSRQLLKAAGGKQYKTR